MLKATIFAIALTAWGAGNIAFADQADEAQLAVAEASQVITASLRAKHQRARPVDDVSCRRAELGAQHICTFQRPDGSATKRWSAVLKHDGSKWTVVDRPQPADLAYLPLEYDGMVTAKRVTAERCLADGGWIQDVADGTWCSIALMLPLPPRE